MSLIRVEIYVGIGAWKAHKTAYFFTCPHVGDVLVVDGVSVVCERVFIYENHAEVEETIRFGSEQAAKEYFTKKESQE